MTDRIVIGNPNCTHASIEILGWESPTSTSNLDGNWLNVTLIFQTDHFHGALKAALLSGELKLLRQELDRLYKDLAGTTKWSSTEQDITLEFRGDGRGHFLVSVAAVAYSGHVESFQYELEMDQTELPALIQQLKKAEVSFPEVGR